ncbi:MAG: hypothetical protein R2865_12195 [Deinococcales bacterium]
MEASISVALRCKVNPDWEPEKPLNVIKVIIPNAAGGFSGIRFELPTKEDLEAIDHYVQRCWSEQLKKRVAVKSVV